MNISEIVEQLSPNNRQLAEKLIMQLAAQDGLKVDFDDSYKLPIENLPLWVANMKSEGKSPRTIEGYGNDARRLLKIIPQPAFLDLQQYFAGRLDTVTSTRVNSEQKAMKCLFKFLYKAGLYPSDPTRDIKLIPDTEKQIEMPTDEQMDAVLTHTPRRLRDRAKYKTMLILLTGTGLRISEACGLQKRFVNFDIREIKVLGKGNKERIIPLSDTVAYYLYEFMLANKESKSQFVFPDSHDNGFAYHGGFRGALRLACIKKGVPPIHPHQLRHYFATKTLEHGAKLEVISKILGHKNVSITAQVYRHIQLQEFHKELDTHDPFKNGHLALPAGPTIEGEFKEVNDDSKD